MGRNSGPARPWARPIGGSVALCGASIVVAGVAWASWPAGAMAPAVQPGTPTDKRAFLARIQQSGVPGPQHEKLAALVGEFDCTITLWPAPGTPSLTARATATGTWIMGKRFVQVINQPAAGEELAIESMQVVGFDRRAAKYFCWSIDSTDTYSLLAKGPMDEETSAMVLLGASEVPGRAAESFKQVIRLDGPDRYVTQVWLQARDAPGADADGWFKAVELAYARRAEKNP